MDEQSMLKEHALNKHLGGITRIHYRPLTVEILDSNRTITEASCGIIKALRGTI